MNYIEVTEGTSICVDKIEAIIINPDGVTSTVRTNLNTYHSTFPYDVLLQLVNRKEEQPRSKEELNIFRTLGSFAG
jgi:hypothetical protein